MLYKHSEPNALRVKIINFIGKKMHTSGFELLLPEGVLDYFEIINVEQTKGDTSIYLQEKNVIPEEYIGRRLEYKGFYEDSKVQNFPLRGKAVYLIVRRRWIDKDTGDMMERPLLVPL